MKRLGCLVFLVLVGGCASKLTPPEVCEAVCQKLTSCPDAKPGDDQACVTGFECAMWTDQTEAAQEAVDCEQACLSQPSCSDAYRACRSQCLHPNPCADGGSPDGGCR